MEKIKEKPPISNGEKYQVDIIGLSHQGEGVGKVNGFTIFIPQTLPGELVEVEIAQVKKSFGRGKLIRIIKKAPGRVDVECASYQSCGGCQLLHLDYQEQLNWKKRHVEETIQRIGGIKAPVQPVLGMANPHNYRNKVQLHFERGELGYYEAKTNSLVALEDCRLWGIETKVLVDELKKLLKISWAAKTNQLNEDLKGIVVREGQDKQLMVVFLTKTKNVRTILRDLTLLLVEAMPKHQLSIYQSINPKEEGNGISPKLSHLAGKRELSIKLGELEFFVSPAAFFQVNTSQAEVLYEQVAKYAQLKGDETVVDAYCGTGTIGLYLAKAAKELVGIEVMTQAIEDAKRNAIHNRIANAKFLQGAVEELLPTMVQEGFTAQVVILDPPRAGCDPKVLEAIIAMQPQRIVYVSCDPATLARDLKLLSYEVIEVQPVDMFAHSGHVETIIMMTKCGSEDKK